MFVSNSTAQFRDRMAYAEKKMQPLKIVGKHSKVVSLFKVYNQENDI